MTVCFSAFRYNVRVMFTQPRTQELILRCFLLLQGLHSLLFFAASATAFVFQDFSAGIWGWQLERLIAALLSFVVTLLLLRKSLTAQRAWGLTLLLTIDIICYAIWAWAGEAPAPKILLTIQVVMAPFVAAVLKKRMRNSGATVADLLVAGTAVALAAAVVFVRGSYYPTSSVYWMPVPPLYYRLLTYSDFHWPQEKSFALLILAYLAVSSIWKVINRGRFALWLTHYEV